MQDPGALPSPPAGRAADSPHEIDALIVGGGVAGLWLLNLLTRRGYRVILLEARELGCEQTLASQGMIHGGLKYALAGMLTPASEAIAGMPDRWAACLAGRGDVDLSGLQPLADRYCMFAAASTLGQLTTFFASRALRGRIRRLAPDEYPSVLADPGFRGVVYALGDFVVDTPALLSELLRPVADRAYRQRLPAPDARLELTGYGVRATLGGTTLAARRLILTAGAGNEALLAALGLDAPRMQRRPLQQVVVRAPDLEPLFAHCLTGVRPTGIRRPEPRLTITSHRSGGGWLWYLGGQLATDGAAMTPADLVAHARRELEACLPWRSWRDATLETLRVDRAEPLRPDGLRPDEAFAEATGPGGACIVGWPTKLSLVPDLGDRVLALLSPPNGGNPTGIQLSTGTPLPTGTLLPTGAWAPALALPAATVGAAPWDS